MGLADDVNVLQTREMDDDSQWEMSPTDHPGCQSSLGRSIAVLQGLLQLFHFVEFSFDGHLLLGHSTVAEEDSVRAEELEDRSESIGISVQEDAAGHSS